MADISNVVASYEFDSELTDSINGGDAWTASGTWTWETPPSGWTNAYRQNASGDVLTISSEPSWWSDWIANGACTVEILVRANGDASSFDNYFFSQTVTGSPFRLIELWFQRFGGGWHMSVNNESATNPSVSDSITGTQVFHLFAAFDGTAQTLTVYDGSSTSSDSATASATPATANAFSTMTFGGANWDSLDVGLVRFWDTALTTGEIATQVSDPFGITAGNSTTTVNLTGASIEPAVNAPVLASSVGRMLTGASLGPVVGTPSVTQIVSRTLMGTALDPVVRSPSVSASLVGTITGAAIAPEVAAPTTRQITTRSITGASIDPAVGAPALPDFAIRLDGLAVDPVVYAPSNIRTQSVTLAGLSIDPIVDTVRRIDTPTARSRLRASLELSSPSATLSLADVFASLRLDDVCVRLSADISLRNYVASDQSRDLVGVSIDPAVQTPTRGSGASVLLSGAFVSQVVRAPKTIQDLIQTVQVSGVSISPVVGDPSFASSASAALTGAAINPAIGTPVTITPEAQSVTLTGVSIDPSVGTPLAATQNDSQTIGLSGVLSDVSQPAIAWTLRTMTGRPADAAAAVAAAQSAMGFSAAIAAPPVTSSTLNCSTPAQVVSALGSNAVRINITGDMTGSSFVINTGRTDIHIVGDSPNIGTWYIGEQCRRISFDGVRMEGSDIFAFDVPGPNMASDITFTGCRFVNGGRGGGGSCLTLRGKRILVENCDTEDEIQDYAIYMDDGFGTTTRDINEDIVVVNNRLRVGILQACTRFVYVHRLVMTGNKLVSRSRHNFRLHAEAGTTNNVYFSHNYLLNRGQMHGTQPAGSPTDDVSDVLIQYNTTEMRDVPGRPTSETFSMTEFEESTANLYRFAYSHNWVQTPAGDEHVRKSNFAATTGGLWVWDNNTTVDVDGTLKSVT